MGQVCCKGGVGRTAKVGAVNFSSCTQECTSALLEADDSCLSRKPEAAKPKHKSTHSK